VLTAALGLVACRSGSPAALAPASDAGAAGAEVGTDAAAEVSQCPTPQPIDRLPPTSELPSGPCIGDVQCRVDTRDPDPITKAPCNSRESECSCQQGQWACTTISLGKLSCTPDYPAWWYPQCAVADGNCTDPACRPAHLKVSATPCGSYTAIDTGCVPRDLTTTGWLCEVDQSSMGDIVVVTLDAPSTFTGMRTCVAAGLTASAGELPQCPDGGGP